METKTPASAPASTKAERKRIPMAIPQRKLEVPEIDGWHLHWFLDANVPRAQQGGYEMVRSEEVPTFQFNVANDKTVSGNADLGSNVRVIAGTGENGQPQYLNLMKIRQEWWQEDQKVLEKRNADVLGAIFVGENLQGSDKSSAVGDQRYTKTALLQRPTRKAK